MFLRPLKRMLRIRPSQLSLPAPKVERFYPAPVRTTHRLSVAVFKPQLSSSPILPLLYNDYPQNARLICRFARSAPSPHRIPCIFRTLSFIYCAASSAIHAASVFARCAQVCFCSTIALPRRTISFLPESFCNKSFTFSGRASISCSAT